MFERFFAVVRLGDQKFVHADAEPRRIFRVHRVLRINEGAPPALLLRLRHDVQRERGFPARLRAVDLHDPAARQAADAQCKIKRE